jgi:hypothetical protein
MLVRIGSVQAAMVNSTASTLHVEPVPSCPTAVLHPTDHRDHGESKAGVQESGGSSWQIGSNRTGPLWLLSTI